MCVYVCVCKCVNVYMGLCVQQHHANQNVERISYSIVISELAAKIAYLGACAVGRSEDQFTRKTRLLFAK